MWYALIALYVVGFVVALVWGYKTQVKEYTTERSYPSCWALATVWPLSLVLLCFIVVLSWIHDKLIELVGG